MAEKHTHKVQHDCQWGGQLMGVASVLCTVKCSMGDNLCASDAVASFNRQVESLSRPATPIGNFVIVVLVPGRGASEAAATNETR